MPRFEDTAAADIDLEEELENSKGVNFVKIAELEEVEFTVLAARLRPSTFNEAKTTAEITFIYPDEDEDTDLPNQFTTEQSLIKKQVQRWTETKQKFPVEGVTVRAVKSDNGFGRPVYALGNAIPEPEEVEETPKSKSRNGGTVSKPLVRDVREDEKRGRLGNRAIGRTR